MISLSLLVQSARALLRARVFSSAALLTIALGAGATAAMFLIVDAVLLRPFPYPNMNRLVAIWEVNRSRGLDRIPVPGAEFEQWRHSTRSFDQTASFNDSRPVWQSGQGKQTVLLVEMTAALPSMLGAIPLLGRGFTEADEQAGPPTVAILSYSAWQEYFHEDPRVIGSRLEISSRPVVIGIMPPDFRFFEFFYHERPLGFTASRQSRGPVLARMRPGVTLRQSCAEMDAVVGRTAGQAGLRAEVVPLREQLLGSVERPLLVLFGAVGFVLLIACANLSSLLLARNLALRKADCIRLTLGAGRGTLIRQRLTEAVILAVLGSAAGLGIAVIIVRKFAMTLGREFPIARLDEVVVDGGATGFTFVLALLITGLCMVAPGLDLWRFEFDSAMGRASGRSSRFGLSARNLLVTGQVSLALALLAGAVLMLQSLAYLRNRDLGYDYRNVLSLRVVLLPFETSAEQAAFWEKLTAYARSLPAVEAVGGTWLLPTSTRFVFPIGSPQGFVKIPGEAPTAKVQRATAGYFKALRIGLVRGRMFQDDEDCDNTHPVLINERMARRYWPGADPVGRQLTEPVLFGNTRFRIVGVVKDAYESVFRGQPQSIMYACDTNFALHILVRGTGDVERLAGPLVSWIRAANKEILVDEVAPFEELIESTIAQPRLQAFLLEAFAGIGLALTLVGAYGVVAYSAQRRTKEYGIRMAVGAQPRDVLILVLRQSLIPTLFGAGIGLGLALAVSRLVSGMLYGTNPANAVALGAAAALLVCVGLGAGVLPAIRAMRIDPAGTLRED